MKELALLLNSDCLHLAIGDNLLEESRQEICLLHYPAFLHHALPHPSSRCSKEMSQMFKMFNRSSVLCPTPCRALHALTTSPVVKAQNSPDAYNHSQGLPLFDCFIRLSHLCHIN